MQISVRFMVINPGYHGHKTTIYDTPADQDAEPWLLPRAWQARTRAMPLLVRAGHTALSCTSPTKPSSTRKLAAAQKGSTPTSQPPAPIMGPGGFNVAAQLWLKPPPWPPIVTQLRPPLACRLAWASRRTVKGKACAKKISTAKPYGPHFFAPALRCRSGP
jgi:hypothetical protein